MRKAAIAVFGLALLALSQPPLLAREPPTRSAALPPSARAAAAAVDAFHAALKRGDARAAAAVLAEDALIFESGEAEHSKAEYAAHHLPADAEFSRGVSSVVTRRSGRSDGNLAWIASEGRTTGTYQGRVIDSLSTETMILRRVGRSWKIIHIHWSSRS